jgi:hypothetical protein
MELPLPGRRAFVAYGGYEHRYHERLVRAYVDLTNYVVSSPEYAVYTEQLDSADPVSMAFPLPVGTSMAQTYRIAALSAAAESALIVEGALVASQERAALGLAVGGALEALPFGAAAAPVPGAPVAVAPVVAAAVVCFGAAASFASQPCQSFCDYWHAGGLTKCSYTHNSWTGAHDGEGTGRNCECMAHRTQPNVGPRTGVPQHSDLAYEHEIHNRALEIGAIVDGLSLKNSVMAKFLSRRLQLMEEAVLNSPDNPNYEGARHFLGVQERRGKALIAPSLKAHVAAELSREAAIQEEKRKAREARPQPKPNGNKIGGPKGGTAPGE